MRRSGERRDEWVCAAAVAVWLALSGAAWAAGPTTVAWSTYLRAGPGQSYAAIAELEHDARVQVAGCAGRWCRASDGAAEGYVDRDALTLPRTLQPATPARSDCVVVGQSDNRRPIPTRFCSAAPGGS